METSDIISKIESKERKTRKRVMLLTLIPIISSIILLGYTSERVIDSRNELKSIENRYEQIINENSQLLLRNDSLSLALRKSTETLGRSTSVLWELKKFIDAIEPDLRTYEEAKFFIRFRMMEEKIRGDYEELSKTVSELPNIKDENNWIVIVESNVSLEDLKKSQEKLESIYSEDQIVIYKDANDVYALALKGNGSFTRAYRLNVELRDKYGYYGAYFRGIKDWGKDYSK